jgi:hypothetical protein
MKKTTVLVLTLLITFVMVFWVLGHNGNVYGILEYRPSLLTYGYLRAEGFRHTADVYALRKQVNGVIFHYNAMTGGDEDPCFVCWTNQKHRVDQKIVYFDLETVDSTIALKTAENIVISYGGKLVDAPETMFRIKTGCSVVNKFTGEKFVAKVRIMQRPAIEKPLFSEEGWSDTSFELLLTDDGYPMRTIWYSNWFSFFGVVTTDDLK